MKENISRREPHARSEGLVVRELPGEVLVYDLERHKAICLNRTAAVVWKHCDGRTDASGIARRAGKELGQTVADEVVWLALDQLWRDNLLRERAARPQALAGISRRELMRRAGIAAAVALPLVASIVAPTAAQASSCLPTGAACSNSAQCCSNVCDTGQNPSVCL